MLPITKNIIKQIRSLEQRKFRRQEGEFVAEGNKLVQDNLQALSCHRLVATPDWWTAHPEAEKSAEECYVISPADMERLSLMQSPQEVLGAFRMPNRVLDSDIEGIAELEKVAPMLAALDR